MNPFRDTIVSNPWDEAAVDVTEIQSDVFDECLRGVDGGGMKKGDRSIYGRR